MSTIQGKVKWFNGKKGYGFIERDDKEKDAFVHASAVKAAGMRYLNEGDKIEFTLEDGPKGPSAVNLKKRIDTKKRLKLGKHFHKVFIQKMKENYSQNFQMICIFLRFE